ncbi:MAG TPA: UPF0175 family protein [Thermoanaerobaculia bacterium]|jgi:predicted HTH domain antitoxin
MTHVEVTFPDSLFAALRKAPHEVGPEVRIAASIHWYQQAAISMERAAEFAGLNRSEFLAELARRHVSRGSHLENQHNAQVDEPEVDLPDTTPT